MCSSDLLSVHDEVHRIGRLSLLEDQLTCRNIENFPVFCQGTKLFKAQTCQDANTFKFRSFHNDSSIRPLTLLCISLALNQLPRAPLRLHWEVSLRPACQQPWNNSVPCAGTKLLFCVDLTLHGSEHRGQITAMPDFPKKVLSRTPQDAAHSRHEGRTKNGSKNL